MVHFLQSVFCVKWEQDTNLEDFNIFILLLHHIACHLIQKISESFQVIFGGIS